MERVEIKLIAHVNDEGRPLCNQDGDYQQLCEPDEFDRLPKECRCERCEQLLGYCRDTNSLMDGQQQLLTEISRRTPNGDSWCPVSDLIKKKTASGWTSLHRSLQRLEVRGLIERKTDSHNRAFVRLSNKGQSDSGRLFDVYQIGE
jgi:hypothetical protein